MNNEFLARHIGLSQEDINIMLATIKADSLDDMITRTLPSDILLSEAINCEDGETEQTILDRATQLSQKNQVLKTFIGQGYYNTLTPSVIAKNILENPGWYTAYTPYQAEISQGRLEMLLNFQQMITDLTGMEISNASLLDEATAAAEAMSLCQRVNRKHKSMRLFVDQYSHPQTIAILSTRAKPLGIEIVLGDMANTDFEDYFAAVLPYPNTLGQVNDLSAIIAKAKTNNVMSIVSSDLLALTLLKTPAQMGADVVIGSSQRFGVPLGFGGPHAAFLATKDEYKRTMAGRVIGVSKDVKGNQALRMALQTREQHIRRDKATSNICTAQVLLAVIAAAYAIYHGKSGLLIIAKRIHHYASELKVSLIQAGLSVLPGDFFDTITLETNQVSELMAKALTKGMNLRQVNETQISVAFDETTVEQDVVDLLWVFGVDRVLDIEINISPNLQRTGDFLSHPVFNLYHSETQMMRYLSRLENKDIALNHSMIALGSCTMKLNAATQMKTIMLPGFSQLHPYAPIEQTQGYIELLAELADELAEVTGYDKVSLQPNAGSQGEFAGLLAIGHYHKANGEGHRNICLIPTSAHGTNPASCVMAGMVVKTVKCDERGNVDIVDLEQKVEKYSADLSAIMITYPSTHGVFEAHITTICALVHKHGGQVYLDGANLNAMVGLAKVGKFGADVSHINLHKTFAIPHGGGGPGMGPIGVKAHLADYLPGNPLIQNDGAVSAAQYGSASILPITWAYMKLLGGDGMTQSSKIAILNANYVANSLAEDYPVLYRGDNGFVAHECILDLRPIKAQCGITEEDIAKRLIDYGFHAPTMSFPVPGTLMVEPTESESKIEIDRFITAMKQIKVEVEKVVSGVWDKDNNPLKNSPHTIKEVVSDWDYPYTREEAVFPVPSLKDKRYFASVKRVDNVYGDKNLFCGCPSIESYE